MSRIRTNSNETAATAVIQISTDNEVSWSNYSTPIMKSPDAQSRWMIDEITPSFSSRRARGEIIMNPCESMESTIIRRGSYGYAVRRRRLSDSVVVNAFAARCLGTYTSQFRLPRTMIPEMDSTARAAELSAFGLTSGLISTLEQRALVQALSKATSPDALGLVTVAEFDKTVNLMKSCAANANSMATMLESIGPKRIRELNTSLRTLAKLNRRTLIKSFLRSLDRVTSSIASSWLGYRYGIMATVYDVQSWITASHSGAKRTKVVATVYDSFDNMSEDVTYPNWQGIPYLNTGPATYQTRRVRKSYIRAGVLIGNETNSAANRFGFNRLASTAWELIPFSFVLDWLVDAGDRLAASEGSLLIKPIGTWLTHEHHLSYIRSMAWSPQNSSDATYSYEASGQDSAVVSEACLYRKRIANPSLSYIPQLNVKLNWKRILDSVSLIRVASRRISSAALKKL